MPEISPDLSDRTRCVSVHWNLPVQCVLPAGHRENNHEAWHPQTGNRMRYRRSMGVYRTEELHHDAWHDLEIPPPGGYCNDQHGTTPDVRCTQEYGHQFTWNHTAIVNGCRYTWNTPIPKALNSDQLSSDVKQLRGLVVQLIAENAKLDKACDEVMRERDGLHDALDQFAQAVAPEDVIGEHSSGNNPWANALDLLTPMAEVDKLRADNAELEKALGLNEAAAA